ncbi:MAG: cytochrome b/b6 domain-containing protein [Acidihalobacter sp.]|jgi:cytochrome b
MQEPSTIKVWDPLIRIFHWTLVAAFTVAYLSGDELTDVHTIAGYVVASAVLVRLVWGLVGTRHARFSDFIYRPSKVLAYLRDLLMLRSPRYLGHNPAGGVMVVLLLVSLLATTGTGLVLYGGKGGGPLAGLLASAPAAPAAQTAAPALVYVDDEREEHGGHEGGEHEGGIIKDMHEFFANFTLALVFAHIAGVFLDSLLHRENLVRAMVTGRKRRLRSDE